MARRRGNNSGGRRPRRSARIAAPPDRFDDEWLSEIRERFDARYVDLGRYEDRRRWHPDYMPERKHVPTGLWARPRILIVPEGHRLARHQTYGGRYSLRGIKEKWKYRKRSFFESYGYWTSDLASERHVKLGRYGDIPRRVGFAHPWQVIICVRRKRRRAVMFALKYAGLRGIGVGKKWRRDANSNVRC